MQTSPIILIDDDQDDLDLIKEAIRESGIENEIITFQDSSEALAFLTFSNKHHLFILCDINMPGMNGFDLRESLIRDGTVLLKSIPFIFVSTAENPIHVKRAYELQVQGYFKKPVSYKETLLFIKNVAWYWNACSHPNK
ncbi:MAG: response regulator [Flavitalea sp.]